MATPDFIHLRQLLDEEEGYAKTIKPDDPRAGVARQMLAIIEEARGGLQPSADSTANFFPAKQFVEDLVALRLEADQLAPDRGK